MASWNSLPRSVRAAAVWAPVAAACLAADPAGALATDLPPGGALASIPTDGFVTGTLLRDVTHSFERRTDPPLNLLIFAAEVRQRVYREADDTLTFYYSVTGGGGLSDLETFSIYGFESFTTDISFVTMPLIPPARNNPDTVARSAGGGDITFSWAGNPMQGDEFTSSIRVRTNAKDYYTPGPVLLGGGTPRPLYTVCIGTAEACSTYYPSLAPLPGLGVRFARPTHDTTPPVVSIDSPPALTCACNPTLLTGTATDPDGLDKFVLEFGPGPGGPWTEFFESRVAVSNGELCTWDTSAAPAGYTWVRLRATNYEGLVSDFVTSLYVDKSFQPIALRSPLTGNVVGGVVCFDGSTNDPCFERYTVSYAPLPAGAPFLPVDPASPVYGTPIVNDGLGSWGTASGPAAAPDGAYRVRLEGVDICGNAASITRDITVDNTPPVAVITSPASCTNVSGGLVQVMGTVSDAHLSGWTLQYSGGGSPAWTTIASGAGPVSNGVLGVWDTSALPRCAYALRLIASDSASVSCGATTNQTEWTALVTVGCPGDFDGQSGVNSTDISAFLTVWLQSVSGGCP